MTLDRYGRLVRWAYLFEAEYVSAMTHTTLCALFWRCVVFTPVKILAAVLLAGLGIFLFGFLFSYALFSLIFAMTLIPHAPILLLALIGIGLILASWGFHLSDTTFTEVVDEFIETEAVQMAVAVKRGICPIIRFE